MKQEPHRKTCISILITVLDKRLILRFRKCFGSGNDVPTTFHGLDLEAGHEESLCFFVESFSVVSLAVIYALCAVGVESLLLKDALVLILQLCFPVYLVFIPGTVKSTNFVTGLFRLLRQDASTLITSSSFSSPWSGSGSWSSSRNLFFFKLGMNFFILLELWLRDSIGEVKFLQLLHYGLDTPVVFVYLTLLDCDLLRVMKQPKRFKRILLTVCVYPTLKLKYVSSIDSKFTERSVNVWWR